MAINSYSDRQIEVANLLESIGKDGKSVPPETINEILRQEARNPLPSGLG